MEDPRSDDPGGGVLVTRAACPVCKGILDAEDLEEHMDERHDGDDLR